MYQIQTHQNKINFRTGLKTKFTSKYLIHIYFDRLDLVPLDLPCKYFNIFKKLQVIGFIT